MPTDDQIAKVKTNLSRLQSLNDQVYNYGNAKIANAFALLSQKDDTDLGLQIGLNLLCGAFWAAGGEFGPAGAIAANFMSGLVSGYAVSTPPSLNQTFSSIINRFQQTSIQVDSDLATLYSDPVTYWNTVYTGTFTNPFGTYTVSGTLAELSTVDIPAETDPVFEVISIKAVYGLDQVMWSILLTRFVITTFSPNEELYQSHIPDINAWAQDYYNAHRSYWCTWVYYSNPNKPNKNHWDTTEHNIGTGASMFSDGSLNDNACNYLFIDSTDGTVINSNGLFGRTFVFTSMNIPQKTHDYHSTAINQKIGIWHESIPNQCNKTELQFKKYCDDYIKYITKKNITRAFFLIQDPFFCQYVKQNWVVTHWLDKLPLNCEAGFVIDTEPDYPWNGSPSPWKTIGGKNDMIELAFQEVVRLNSLAISKKVTCIGFDTENLYLGSVKDTGYSNKEGSLWITKMFKTYLPSIPLDWGWASGRIGGDSTVDIGGARYPEIYWVGETSSACDVSKGGDACTYAQKGTDYCTSLNDVSKLLSGPIGNALNSFSESNQNQEGWAMFSVEKWTKGPAFSGECVASYNTDPVDASDMIPTVKYTIVSTGTTNFISCGAPSNLPGTEFTATVEGTGTGQVTKSAICGLLDAFGIWDELMFDSFLATVQKNYSNVPKVMIYEWNFIPQKWI